MIQAGTVRSHDPDSKGEALIFVRYDTDRVTLGVCIAADGDVDVLLTKDEARQLVEFLRQATE